MNWKRKIKETQYRLNLRKTLGLASQEELDIMKEELSREINRRNKKK